MGRYAWSSFGQRRCSARTRARPEPSHPGGRRFEPGESPLRKKPASAADWSKLELGWHVSATQNHRDAIETVEQAIAESERLLGKPLAEMLGDPVTGEIRPIALVTDNGPCFKSVRFAAYIERRPELIHIRTRRRSPNQNGVRERAFGSLKYEHLYGSRSTTATSSARR